MKKRISVLILSTMLLCMLLPCIASAQSLNWGKVTFSMKVPDGVVVDSPLYVMYTGGQSDLFAELNADNGFTQTIDAPLGDYNIYQVVLSGDSSYQFMGPSVFTVNEDSPTVWIYIMDGENGLINVEATGVEPPADLASYGEKIAKEIEAAQLEDQAELERQQQEALATTPEGAVVEAQGIDDGQPQVQGESGRNTKIKGATGTEDKAKNDMVPLVVAGAAIVGVGLLITVAIMVRKVSKNRGEKDDDNGEGITN